MHPTNDQSVAQLVIARRWTPT